MKALFCKMSEIEKALAGIKEGYIKVIVTEMHPETETEIKDVQWKYNTFCKNFVLVTGEGGDEQSYFNEKAKQDKHYHTDKMTERYTVLKGVMKIEVENVIYTMEAGCSMLIQPNQIHKVLSSTDPFIAQVISTNVTKGNKVIVI